MPTPVRNRRSFPIAAARLEPATHSLEGACRLFSAMSPGAHVFRQYSFQGWSCAESCDARPAAFTAAGRPLKTCIHEELTSHDVRTGACSAASSHFFFVVYASRFNILHSRENPAGGTPRDWISRAQKLTWTQVLAMMTIPRSVKYSFNLSMTCAGKERGVAQTH